MTPDYVMVSIKLCLEVGIVVLKSQEAKKRSLNKVKECTYKQMT